MKFRSVRSTTYLLLLLPFAGASALAQTASADATTTPSAIMRPALDSLHQALLTLRPERWKAPAQITGESSADISSIERDLDNALPPLLSAADAAPASPAQLLPAYRNVDALYDVVVRVTQTAVLAAPQPQSTALQQATAALQQSRRDLGDLLDGAVQLSDHQLRDTQTRLHTLQATPPPPVPVCPPPPSPVVKKAKPRVKPATSTTTPTSTSTTH